VPRSAAEPVSPHAGGVLEFIAQEGMVYLPFWMMENMHLNEGDVIHLRSATIPKGSFVKLQPQTSDFLQINNPKAVLEKSLGSFSALTKGETFRIFYNKKKCATPTRTSTRPYARGHTRTCARPHGLAHARLRPRRACPAVLLQVRHWRGAVQARARRLRAGAAGGGLHH
jgi:hypothetical protein